MKMTRLEWRYLQRIALDHPYFDTHKLPLTEKEAKAIVEANNTMTGKEFVDSIYAKLGMTRPEEKKDRFAWLRSFVGMLTVPSIRRIAIAVLVVILMTVFFVATPTGRAIAESVIHYIVTLFDDGRLVMNQSDNETPLNSIENADDDNTVELQEGLPSLIHIDSFDDFQKATGKTPVILPLPCTELYYFWEPDTDYMVLSATYATDDGTIIALQTWNADDLISTTSMGFMEYDADRAIYYSIEEEGQIVINKVFVDSVFGINAQGHFILDELVELIED